MISLGLTTSPMLSIISPPNAPSFNLSARNRAFSIPRNPSSLEAYAASE